MITITLPGPPIPRVTHRNKGKFHYDPQKQKMDNIRMQVKVQVNDYLHSEDPEISGNALKIQSAEILKASLYFGFPVPKNWSRRKINASLWKTIYHNHKPDCDNLQKMYFDCVKNIVMQDDCKICVLENVVKCYDIEPKTVITLYDMTPMDEPSFSDDLLSEFSPKELFNFALSATIIYRILDNNQFFGKYSDGTRKNISKQLQKIAHMFGKKLFDISRKYPYSGELHE